MFLRLLWPALAGAKKPARLSAVMQQRETYPCKYHATCTSIHEPCIDHRATPGCALDAGCSVIQKLEAHSQKPGGSASFLRPNRQTFCSPTPKRTPKNWTVVSKPCSFQVKCSQLRRPRLNIINNNKKRMDVIPSKTLGAGKDCRSPRPAPFSWFDPALERNPFRVTYMSVIMNPAVES